MLIETLHTAFFNPTPKERTQKMPAGPIAGEIALSGRKLCEEFAPRNEDARVSREWGANRPAWLPVPDKENYREAVCDVDRNVAHCFFQSSTKKRTQKTPVGPSAGEIALSGRKLCEEFAPRNEDIRLSGERGANRTTVTPAKSHFPAGSCVKNLLPETKS